VADGILILLAGIVGLLVGSFLNVVVWRVPRGESLVSPPSHCPHCEHPILARDNIPVFSWLWLKGRCRHCSARISWRYPAVELGTAVSFAAIAWAVLGGTIALPNAPYPSVSTYLILGALLYLSAISIALTLIDLDHHRLPNAIVLPGYAVGILLLWSASLLAGDLDTLLRSGIGLAAMFIGYLILALAYSGGMGFGDVKLAGVLGLYLGWLGWEQLIVGAFAAFVLGGVFSIVLLVLRRVNRKTGIPFGPWMVVGAWFGILWGYPIVTGYLAFFGITPL
jgi:leader peptidase (prepilin peptidase)/N-methyltransferase